VIKIVLGQDDLIGHWICDQTNCVWTSGRGICIGMQDFISHEIIGGVIFEAYAGDNIFAHIVIARDNMIIPKSFLLISLYYVFVQLKCESLSVVVLDSNLRILSMIKRLGFVRIGNLHSECLPGSKSIYKLLKSNGMKVIERRM
jgi:hypothetical protein